MRIRAFFTPRRVILALICLLGLVLRLWGLSWGPSQAEALHPVEWTWQVIESLSLDRPTYPGVLTQAFFTLAALLHGLIHLTAGLWDLLLGRLHLLSADLVSARLAGRLTVALLGALQIPLAYLVARRFFDSLATGLLAAGLLAFSPLLVAYSHYLTLDVPLSFAVLGCLWVAWLMVEQPGPLVMFQAGLVLGLTITTRFSGICAAPVLILAYALAWRGLRPRPVIYLGLWPVSALMGLVAGLVVGYPGFLLRSHETGQVVRTALAPPPTPAGGWLAWAAERWQDSLAALGWEGGLLLIFWLLGAVLIIRGRHWRRLLLLVFPPLYFATGALLLKGPVEGVTAVWLPLALMVAVWPVVEAARRLPGRGWPVTSLVVVGALVLALPLWNSLGVGYLFWQQDTLGSAHRWWRDNLPPRAPVLVGPGTPRGLFARAQSWEQGGAWDRMRERGGYLVTSALDQGVPPASPAPGLDLKTHLQAMASFDLKSHWRRGVGRPDPGFLRWISPRVDIYATQPRLEITQPLGLYRPPVGLGRPYALVYCQARAYSRHEASLLLDSGGEGQRVLLGPQGLRGLGLQLSNLGEDLALLEISQGPWPAQPVSLYPGQEVELRLPARNWPPMTRGSYPVGFKVRRGGQVLARLTLDPVLLARSALEKGMHQQVVDELAGLPQAQLGFDGKSMLALALARLDHLDQAEELLRGLGEGRGAPLGDYRHLATAGMVDQAWDQIFRRLTGYHPDLLRHSLTLAYRVGGPACRGGGSAQKISGPGFSGTVLPRPGDQGGHLRVMLADPLPRGPLAARLDFRFDHTVPAQSKVAALEIWGHGGGGSRILAGRPVMGSDISQGGGQVVLPLFNPSAGLKLEVRLVYGQHPGLSLESIQVGVDLQAHLAHVLRWYYDAQGRVSLAAKRYEQAVTAFESLLALDADYHAAYLPLARSLLDVGRVARAYEQAQRAELLFTSQPARLAEVRDLYEVMKKPADVERVDKRLGHLRPSLKRQARFAQGMTLLGYDLSASSAPPGGELEMSYYWRCWAAPPVNYFIFVHLRGDGRMVNYDHLLEHGRRGMTSLRPGEVVRESYKVRLPADLAPGQYRLVVGLWDPHFTGKGVPVVEGTGQGTQEVELTVLEVR